MLRFLGAAALSLTLLLAPGQAAPAAAVRVLFIGNSLTIANDLPKTVTAMATAAGRTFAFRVVAYPDFSLEDHWGRGDAQRAIAEGGWSFVVLQQGPSALPESRVLLRDYTRRYASLASKVGAKAALFMVWPSVARDFDFDGVRDSYRTAAEDVRGVFLPAGEAWRAAWQQNSRLALYGPDGFHPTPLGSYVAAAVMFEAFFDRSPVGLPALGLRADEVRIAQDAAHAAWVASRGR